LEGKHQWIGHFLKVNQQERGEKLMLHEMSNDVGHVALNRAAEVREGWRHRE